MIPAIAHVVWLGPKLPWAYALAVLSAARRGGFDEVRLHHLDAPDDGPGWRAVRREPGVQLVPLDPAARLQDVGPCGLQLAELYRELDAPAAQVNVLRAAILYREGGVYLDTDTITVASMRPLLRAPVFCGLEHIVLPYRVRHSRSPKVWARAAIHAGVRDVLRRLPFGHRLFPAVASHFELAANNAVLGAEPKHPFIAALLAGMARMPPHRRTVRFALGTHLLQKAIDAHGLCREDLVLHPPETFYPLAPEISEHWFRLRTHAHLEHAMTPTTRVIHWYASVRTRTIVPQIDERYVHTHADHQLFSAAARLALAG